MFAQPAERQVEHRPRPVGGLVAGLQLRDQLGRAGPLQRRRVLGRNGVDAGQDLAALARQLRPHVGEARVAHDPPAQRLALDEGHDEAVAEPVLRRQHMAHRRHRRAGGDTSRRISASVSRPIEVEASVRSTIAPPGARRRISDWSPSGRSSSKRQISCVAPAVSRGHLGDAGRAGEMPLRDHGEPLGDDLAGRPDLCRVVGRQGFLPLFARPYPRRRGGGTVTSGQAERAALARQIIPLSLSRQKSETPVKPMPTVPLRPAAA